MSPGVMDPSRGAVYLAGTAECAYAEVLAYTKGRLGQRDPLSVDAAAVGLSAAEFIELADVEWAERQHMGVGHLPSSWRIDRLLYWITLPESGWWVDVEHPDSLAAVETALEAELAALGVPALTVGVLRGDDRRVTTAIARWVHALRFADGHRPLGIACYSKHATGRCWAYWAGDDTTARRRPASDEGSPITTSDVDLRRVAERFRIRVW